MYKSRDKLYEVQTKSKLQVWYGNWFLRCCSPVVCLAWKKENFKKQFLQKWFFMVKISSFMPSKAILELVLHVICKKLDSTVVNGTRYLPHSISISKVFCTTMCKNQVLRAKWGHFFHARPQNVGSFLVLNDQEETNFLLLFSRWCVHAFAQKKRH